MCPPPLRRHNQGKHAFYLEQSRTTVPSQAKLELSGGRGRLMMMCVRGHSDHQDLALVLRILFYLKIIIIKAF
jgi:hypothetical protein